MWIYYVSITLAITANVFYYFIQKSTPGKRKPFTVAFFHLPYGCVDLCGDIPFLSEQ